MSDVEPAPSTDAGVTAGSADLAPELAPEPVAAAVATCPICGHADSAHVAGGRCLVQLGEYGTGGACPCPEAAA